MSKNIVFENLIIEKFNKFRNKNNIWSNDVLDFINEEKDLLEKELDIIEETEYYGIKEEKLDKIRDYCFSFFTSSRCANIDEDEFDSKNDLDIYTWEIMDDILFYYYQKCVND